MSDIVLIDSSVLEILKKKKKKNKKKKESKKNTSECSLPESLQKSFIKIIDETEEEEIILPEHKNVYVAESSIKDAGKGLFAKRDIKKGTRFLEFTGKIINNPTPEEIDDRSSIAFGDGSILRSTKKDLATYVNDLIDFPKEKRNLYESLLKDEPYFKKHPNTEINCTISGIGPNKKVFMVATKDIAKDSELFCHYGFQYWFFSEFKKKNVYIMKKDVPKLVDSKLFKYPAVVRYFEEFYPECSEITIKKSPEEVISLVMKFKDPMKFKDSEHIKVNMTNPFCREMFFRNMLGLIKDSTY